MDLTFKVPATIYWGEVCDLNLVDFLTMEILSKQIKEVIFKALVH